jgi:hypothetical protein
VRIGQRPVFPARDALRAAAVLRPELIKKKRHIRCGPRSTLGRKFFYGFQTIDRFSAAMRRQAIRGPLLRGRL